MSSKVVTGDVIRLFDGTTKPPKPKRFICVYAGEGWFLRINTESHFKPCVPLRQAEFPKILEHDSHLELRAPIEFADEEVEKARNDPKAYLGRLTAPQMRIVRDFVQDAKAFTPIEKRRIVDELNAAIEELGGEG